MRAIKKMIRIVPAALFLMAALLACPSAPARCPPPARLPSIDQLQATSEAGLDHGFLWRISKGGRSSYLYGTIHVGRPDWMNLGPQLLQALRASDTLALELDPLDPDIQLGLAQGLADAKDPPLPDELNLRLREQADAACISYDTIAALVPELQVEALRMLVARDDGLDPAFGIDPALAAIGHALGQHVVSLETIELQLQTLHSKDAQEAIDYVQDGLQEIESGRARAMAVRIAQVWEQSDYEQMARFAQWCQCLETPSERRMLHRALDERNPGMVERIDALHTGGSRVFAAVGSLHLFGDSGLPTLLALRGYRVERIDLQRRPHAPDAHGDTPRNSLAH